LKTVTSSPVKHYFIAKEKWKDKNFLGPGEKKGIACLWMETGGVRGGIMSSKQLWF
jgi:hypothetical protein